MVKSDENRAVVTLVSALVPSGAFSVIQSSFVCVHALIGPPSKRK